MEIGFGMVFGKMDFLIELGRDFCWIGSHGWGQFNEVLFLPCPDLGPSFLLSQRDPLPGRCRHFSSWQLDPLSTPALQHSQCMGQFGNLISDFLGDGF